MRRPFHFPAACIALGLASFSAHAQSLLVINQGDSTLSFVDPASAKQVATLAENTPGVHAHEIAVSADGKTAYLPIYGSVGVGKPGIDGHQMLFVDLPSHKITDTLDFGYAARPHKPVLDPVSGMLYVTTELDKSVTIVDPKTHKIVDAIPTGAEQSHMLVVSHDGKLGYTANVGPGSVSVLDMMARKTLAVIPVAPEVQRIAISNDDKYVFTSDYKTPRLAVIDTATRSIKQWVTLPGLGYGGAVTADGRYLILAIPTPAKVVAIDLKDFHIAHTLDLPAAPQEVLIRPDQKVAYISCNTSGQVAAIDLSTWKVQSLITTATGADGLAWAPR